MTGERAPLVSVVMAAYNIAPYVLDAAHSILSQTFGDFEFIVVNDGSSDGTGGILRALADDRVRLFESDHRGLVASLNQGLDAARGRYIARMDGDDVAAPGRLARQVAFLNRHPNVGIVGSAYYRVDAGGRVIGVVHWPGSDLEIRWVSLLANPFGHSTVMVRRRLLVDHLLRYDEAFHAVEDYDLWTRLLARTTGWNLAAPLARYRVHGAGVSITRRTLQLAHHDVVSARTVRELVPDFSISDREISDLRAAFGGAASAPVPAAERVTLAHLYLDMLEAFLRRHPTRPGVSALRRGVAVRVARQALACLPQPGSARVLRRLARLDPTLPLSSVGYLGRGLAYRLVAHAPGALRRWLT